MLHGVSCDMMQPELRDACGVQVPVRDRGGRGGHEHGAGSDGRRPLRYQMPRLLLGYKQVRHGR